MRPRGSTVDSLDLHLPRLLYQAFYLQSAIGAKVDIGRKLPTEWVGREVLWRQEELGWPMAPELRARSLRRGAVRTVAAEGGHALMAFVVS